MDRSVKVGMVSLGCPKNLVDSEVMLGTLAAHQYQVTTLASEAEVLIVNTCGFIDAAKKESVDTILEMAKLKQDGACKRLVVTGCLVQGYVDELKKDLPEVDAFLGSADYPRIGEVVKGLIGEKRLEGPLTEVHAPVYLYDENTPRLLTTPPYMAYLKIAEGCDHACAFCAIPQLRGRLRSRSVESCLAEARALAGRGVRELNVISQDTSEYGRDLYGAPRLKELMQGLGEVEGLRWVRLHYLFPLFLDDAVMDAMASSPRLAKYVDLPLQHGSSAMLKAMRRPGSRDSNLQLLRRFRERVPGAALRSSFIVGYPGESEAHFEELLGFLEEAQLDRVGVFTYSQEALTPSGTMDGQVPDKLKRERQRRAMETAARISAARLKARIGQTVEVLVERAANAAGTAPSSAHAEDGAGGASSPRRGGGRANSPIDAWEHGAGAAARPAKAWLRKASDLWVGRTQWDAPDIDGKVYFTPAAQAPQPGDFVQVRVESSTEHDLVGEQLS